MHQKTKCVPQILIFLEEQVKIAKLTFNSSTRPIIVCKCHKPIIIPVTKQNGASTSNVLQNCKIGKRTNQLEKTHVTLFLSLVTFDPLSQHKQV